MTDLPPHDPAYPPGTDEYDVGNEPRPRERRALREIRDQTVAEDRIVGVVEVVEVVNETEERR